MSIKCKNSTRLFCILSIIVRIRMTEKIRSAVKLVHSQHTTCPNSRNEFNRTFKETAAFVTLANCQMFIRGKQTKRECKKKKS